MKKIKIRILPKKVWGRISLSWMNNRGKPNQVTILFQYQFSLTVITGWEFKIW